MNYGTIAVVVGLLADWLTAAFLGAFILVVAQRRFLERGDRGEEVTARRGSLGRHREAVLCAAPDGPRPRSNSPRTSGRVP
jgi:hypothetical protein